MYKQADFDCDEPMPVTREQMKRELAKHGVPYEEYDEEHPVSDTYDGRQILQWLGY